MESHPDFVLHCLGWGRLTVVTGLGYSYGRWKRLGLIVDLYRTDHTPRHVHVFEDGKRLLKFDIENWKVIEERLSPRAKKVLECLRSEGVFDEKS